MSTRTTTRRQEPLGLGPLSMTAGLAVAGLATACVWPALRTSTVPAVLVVVVAAAFATTGAAIGPPRVNGGLGGMLLVTGVLWAVSWSSVWQVGPLPALSVLTGASYWVTIAWGCLRYPEGRLTRRSERRYIAAVVFFVPVLAAVSLVVSEPSYYGFHDDVWWPRVVSHEPTYQAIVGLIGLAALVLSVVFGWLVHRRLGRLAVVERRVIKPVAVAFVAAGLTAGVTSIWALAPEGDEIGTIFVPAILTLLGVPLAFPVAVVSRRLTSAAAADLLERLAHPSSIDTVRQVLAEALHDDTVQVLYRLPESDDYVDGDGMLVPTPTRIPAPGRLTLPVKSADGAVVALVRADEALARQRDLVETTVAASGLAIENARLHALLRDQLTKVRASRARVVEAGLDERRRIERDLHDGAQQHLLALAAWLGLARAQAEAPQTREAIDEARELLQDTLRELRRLARGIHPTILVQEGLDAALDSAAQALPMPVEVDAPGSRFDPTTEAVAYLTAWDTLAYLARAGEAARATVRIQGEGGDLWIRVRFEDLTERDHTQATALNVIKDRLRAFDGDLRLDRAQDSGFQLTARIPCNGPATKTPQRQE